MEVIIFIALILVVATKGFTNHSLHALESKIRTSQSEEAEVSHRLQTTESSLRSLEKEHKALGQEIKHLENDKDLATLEVAKAGGKPITEDQLTELLNGGSRTSDRPANPEPALEGAQGQNPGEEALSDEDSGASPTDSTAGEQSGSNSNGKTVFLIGNRRARILVVEDNDELRALLLQALSKDYDVLEAPDGFEALSQVVKQQEKYDLVITDFNMPKVNGITLVENLPEDIPTIIISAFLNKPEFKNALSELKPSSVLEKPFQIAALRAAVEKALSPQEST
jgi:CheY-like chemotaxis protein